VKSGQKPDKQYLIKLGAITLVGLLFCAAVSPVQAYSARLRRTKITSPSPITVEYLAAASYGTGDLLWYYVKTEDWEQDGWEQRIICSADAAQDKWMRLNGRDVKLKLLSTTNPNDAATKGTQFLEAYAAGVYRVHLDYVQTNDPKIDKSDFATYNVKFTLTSGNHWTSFKAKCHRSIAASGT